MTSQAREMTFQNAVDTVLLTSGIKMGGYPDEMFIHITDKEKEQFSCNICFMLVNDCRQCYNNHIFCRSCILAWSLTYGERAQKCPLCRCDQAEYFADKAVDEKLGEKWVKCLEDDCAFKAPLRIFLKHGHSKMRFSNAHVDFERLSPSGLRTALYPSLVATPPAAPTFTDDDLTLYVWDAIWHEAIHDLAVLYPRLRIPRSQLPHRIQFGPTDWFVRPPTVSLSSAIRLITDLSNNPDAVASVAAPSVQRYIHRQPPTSRSTRAWQNVRPQVPTVTSRPSRTSSGLPRLGVAPTSSVATVPPAVGTSRRARQVHETTAPILRNTSQQRSSNPPARAFTLRPATESAAPAGSSQLVSGSSQLVSGSSHLDSGSGHLDFGSGQLVSDSSQLFSSTSQLVADSRQLVPGSSQLVSGSRQLVSGSRQLVSGSGQLDSNSRHLVTGSRQPVSGSSRAGNRLQAVGCRTAAFNCID